MSSFLLKRKANNKLNFNFPLHWTSVDSTGFEISDLISSFDYFDLTLSSMISIFKPLRV